MNIALKNVIRYPKLYYNLPKKRIFLKNIAFARILKYSYNIYENLIRTLLECNRAEYRCIKIIKEIQVNPTFSRYFKSLAWTCTKSFSRSSLRGRKLIRGIARAISHPLSSSIPSFFFSIGWSTLLPILIPKGIIRATTVPGTLRPAIVPASSKNPPSDASSYCARGPNTEFLRRVSGHVTTVKRSVICHGHDKCSSTTATPRV